MKPPQDNVHLFDALLENALAGYWEWRPQEKSGQFCDILVKMLRYNPGELEPVGDGLWRRIVHPEDYPRLEMTYRNHMSSSGKMPFQLELRLMRKDGGVLWGFCTAKTVEWDDAETPTCLVGSIVDITDRKRLEENLRTTLAELDRRNEELASFSFITAHDLRSPITSLVSLADLCKESPTAENMQFAMEQMGVLARDLLCTLDTLNEVFNVKRRPDVVIQEIEIGPVFDMVVSEFNTLLARRDVQIERVFDECPTVPSYEPYLQGILRGLLSNALRYSHPDRTPVVRVETRSYRDKCSLCFSDNGIGIDLARHGRRLFRLQQRLHRTEEETRGAGLFVIKAQVEAMGGSISVSSQVDGGSTFTVFLPYKR